jgi:replicative DNA helicase
MKYKRQKINLDNERKIVIGMIVSTKFLSEVATIYNPNLLQSSFIKTISNWCIEYYQKYQKAPKKYIQEIYNGYKNRKIMEEEQAELIADFLENISFEYEKTNFNNVKYNLDQAEKYFKQRSLTLLNESISSCLIDNDETEAEKLIATYTQVKRPASGLVDIFNDKSVILSALIEDETEEELFKLPGALGELLGSFSRADFVGILAATKRGKTWWLMELGVRAVISKLKVYFISLEMSQKKLQHRFYRNITGTTKRGENKKIDIPFFKQVTTNSFEIDYDIKIKKEISSKRLIKKWKKIKPFVKNGQLKLQSFPADSLTLSDIKNHLYNAEHYQNFIPDVIIIDYADLLLPERKNEYRHQLDSIWKGLRGLAQEKNCLILTATQSNKSGLDKDVTTKDVAEDYRKATHVTSLICLNQTEEEAQNHIMRVSADIQREEAKKFDEVVVLEQKDIGKVYLDSRFKKEVIF